ncbi:MAG: deoxyribonuclease IV [Planctomycetaceae bacterium]
MPLLGAHMSIAGGYYKAADAAAELGMDTVQIFTKNNNQWQGKPLTESEIAAFRESIDRHNLKSPCAHDSYLINLASPNDELWKKSLDAFVIELERAEALGLAGVVMHPGSFVDSSEQEGLDKIVVALRQSLDRTSHAKVQIWLETTAGQGSNLGHRFEHIQYLLDNVGKGTRIGVCVDSCHIFAAGYPVGTPEEYAATFAEFDRTIGVDQIRAFHLNDSKRELGSRVDRHEHIGRGCLGLEPFRHILNDERFADLPMYLETPKGEENGKNLDAVNLRQLRRLAADDGSEDSPRSVKKSPPQPRKKASRKSVTGK